MLRPNGDLAWSDGNVQPEFLTGKNAYMDLMMDDILAEDWEINLRNIGAVRSESVFTPFGEPVEYWGV